MEAVKQRLLSIIGEQFHLGRLFDDSDASPIKKASNLSISLGLNDLGEKWNSVPESESEELLFEMLFKSLAYTSGRTMPEEDARTIASEILNLVNGPKSCLVNFKRHSESIRSSNPLTDATFDAAMAIIGEKEQVLFCRMEED